MREEGRTGWDRAVLAGVIYMRHTYRVITCMFISLIMLLPCFVVSSRASALDSQMTREESTPLVWEHVTGGGWETLQDHVVVLLNAQGNKAVGCTAHDGVLDAVDYEANSQDTAPQWYFEKTADGASLMMFCQTEDDTKLYLSADGNGNLSMASDAAQAASINTWYDGGQARFQVKDVYPNNFIYNSDSSNFGTGGWSDNGKFTVWSAALSQEPEEPEEPGKPDTGDDSTYTPRTDTVSPSSSIINLFDYWEVAGNRFAPTPGWDHGGPTNSNEAINKDHAFKFARLTNSDAQWGTFNEFTGTSDVRTGIVSNTLDYGYPKLSGNTSGFADGTSIEQASESLRYLFDPTFEVADGRAVFPNAKGLLSYTADGYLEYNSMENFARFNEDTHDFKVYTQPATCSSEAGGQFFPFNAASTIASHTESNGCQAGDINHFFGMSITARFVQRYQGHTDATNNKPTTFEFSGDDDVWVFIDDVLVADLGGIHKPASVTIDFTTGNIVINDTQTTTLKDQYKLANRANDYAWLEGTNTFADDTTHTLKFFYLERGSGESNMRIKYNLLDVPETALTKVDQYGDPLEGAVFATYKGKEEANGDVKYLKEGTDNEYISWPANAVVDTNTGVVYTDDTKSIILLRPTFHGATDAHGEILFGNDQGAYTIEEIKEIIGTEFVLRELKVPDGYRTVSDESVLYFSGDSLCTRDPFRNGVWTQPNALVTATNYLYLIDSNSETGHQYVPYYTLDDNGNYTASGTLFAVPLKRNGVPWTSVHNTDDWTALYGNAEFGYSVSEKKGVAGAIEAAQKQKHYNDPVFTARANGMQATLREQPGETTSYYTQVEQTYFGGDTARIIPILAACGNTGKPIKECSSAIEQGLATQEQLDALDSVEYFIAFY